MQGTPTHGSAVAVGGFFEEDLLCVSMTNGLVMLGSAIARLYNTHSEIVKQQWKRHTAMNSLALVAWPRKIGFDVSTRAVNAT